MKDAISPAPFTLWVRLLVARYRLGGFVKIHRRPEITIKDVAILPTSTSSCSVADFFIFL